SLLKALAITVSGARALAASLLVVTEISNHRRTTESNLHALSSVIALYSGVALEFGDRVAAGEALAALEAVPQIEAGVLYDVDGNVFATYGPSPAEARGSDAGLAPGVRYGTSHMDLVRAVEVEGRPVGHLRIRRNTADLVRGLAAKCAALGVAMIGALLLAIVLANRLGRHIARPLEVQVQASAAVADGDLSVQVPDMGSGEVGDL